MFSTAELTRLRAVQADFLPDTCEIINYTVAADTRGGQTDTWEVAGQGVVVACRVASSGLTPDERAIAQRISTERMYLVTLPNGTTITALDRILWSGRTFEVKHPGGGTSETAKRVLVEEVA